MIICCIIQYNIIYYILYNTTNTKELEEAHAGALARESELEKESSQLQGTMSIVSG